MCVRCTLKDARTHSVCVYVCVCVYVHVCTCILFSGNLKKQIPSHEKGGGVRGAKQQVQMLAEYKIVILPDTRGTQPCIKCPQCLGI